MNPVRAFFLSFGGGLLALFSGHAALSAALAQQPDIRAGAVAIPSA
jgi:hypothetical protein